MAWEPLHHSHMGGINQTPMTYINAKGGNIKFYLQAAINKIKYSHEKEFVIHICSLVNKNLGYIH